MVHILVFIALITDFDRFCSRLVLVVYAFGASVYNLNKEQLEQIKTNALENFAILEAVTSRTDSNDIENIELNSFESNDELALNQMDDLLNKRTPPNKRKVEVRMLHRRLSAKSKHLEIPFKL